MKRLILLFAVLCWASISSAAPKRSKREAYDLPDGTDLLVAPIRTSFECPADGYYADTDNDCKIFHVCHSSLNGDGSVSTQHFSFVCGNQTVFNQLTFTCAYPEEAVPCLNAPDFYYLNDNVLLGDADVPFLTDQDVERAAPLIPGLAAYNEREPPARTPIVQPPPPPPPQASRGSRPNRGPSRTG